MPQNLQNCPVCGSLLRRHFLVCKDYTASQQEFQIVRCENCGFKFTNPRPSENEIGAFYQSPEYISHSDTRKGLVNKAYRLVRNLTLRRKIELAESLVSKHIPARRLLDIGCGTGHFLELCRKSGWQTKGIETDAKTRETAIKNSGSSVQADFLTAYTDEKFDIITMWHVLEHVHRLEETIAKIYGNLSDKGTLLVAVPNSDAWDARHYAEHWAAYDVPRHLYHFNQPAVKRLFEKFGFKVVQIKPMPFDAFYISMLSTRYRDGKTNYAEAFLNGLKSNAHARRNGGDYSSLIYVIRKI